MLKLISKSTIIDSPLSELTEDVWRFALWHYGCNNTLTKFLSTSFNHHSYFPMQIYRLKIILYLSIAMLGLISSPLNADCGRVTIAEMNWPSAQLVAHVDKYVLAEGFNCDVTLVPGDTVPTIRSMIGIGEPSLAPEVWVFKVEARTASTVQSTLKLKKILETANRNGLIKDRGNVFLDNGQDGFWVPAHMLKQYPELESISGVLNHPELFPHPDKSNRSAFYGCPIDWSCNTTTTQLHKLYDLTNYGFDLVTPESGADFAASISKTLDEGKGWFGYYWEPTASIGKHDLVKVRLLDEGHEFEYVYIVKTYVSKSMFNKPLIMTYLKKRIYPNEIISRLLSWKEEMQATESDTVKYFLRNYNYLWSQWVDFYTASRIKASL